MLPTDACLYDACLFQEDLTVGWAELLSRLFLASFICIFIYIVLNICILITEDAYFEVLEYCSIVSQVCTSGP